MRQVIYAMRFTGEGTPAGEGMLRAATSSPSTRITSGVGGEGVAGTLEAFNGAALSSPPMCA